MLQQCVSSVAVRWNIDLTLQTLDALQVLELALVALEVLLYLAVDRLACLHVLEAPNFEAILQDLNIEIVLGIGLFIFKQLDCFSDERDAFLYVIQVLTRSSA